MNCHYYVEWYLALFLSMGLLSFYLPPQITGCMLLRSVAFYFVSLARSPDFKLIKGDRDLFITDCKRIWKIFYKIKNYSIKTIASLTISLKTKEYFIIRNIKNASLKGHLENHVISCCLWWFSICQEWLWFSGSH